MAALGNVAQEVVPGIQDGQFSARDSLSAKNVSLFIPRTAISEPWLFVAGGRVDRYRLAGTLKNSAGVGIVRTVVSYDQALHVVDDVTLSDSSGNFVLRPASATNHHAVFHIPTDAHDGVIFTDLVPVP